MRTKEQIKAYNKEYFARPEVIARAKIRNTKYRQRRKEYKKTPIGRANENKYRRKRHSQVGIEKHLITRYKINLEEYNNILAKQDNKCAICKKESNTRLHVDHCHDTLKVRGLLCGNCNRALGLFYDNIDSLEKAIVYLKYGK